MSVWDHLEELRRRLIVIGRRSSSSHRSSSTSSRGTSSRSSWRRSRRRSTAQPLNILGPFESFTFRFKVALYGALVIVQPDHHLADPGVLHCRRSGPRSRATSCPRSSWRCCSSWRATCSLLRGPRPGVRVDARARRTATSCQMLPEASRYLTGVVMLLLGFGLGFRDPDRHLLPRRVRHRPVQEAARELAYRLRRPHDRRLGGDARLVAGDHGTALRRAARCSTRAACFLARVVLSKRIRPSKAEDDGY